MTFSWCSGLRLPHPPLIFSQSKRAPQQGIAFPQSQHSMISRRSIVERCVSLQCPAQVKASASAEVAADEVLQTWRTAQAVCFDVDSTLCTDESIDEVAAYLGLGAEVAALTNNAMGGTVKFQDALAGRLNLMKPSRQLIDEFLRAHPPSYSPGIPELVAKLHGRGTAVFLVSGGFRLVIDPIARELGIPLSNVYANTLLFQDDGSYAGFDPSEFTSRSGGKAEAAQAIKAKHGFSTLVAIGDGATDLEARTPGGADLFIGYGGVAERKIVKENADWFVYDIHTLIEALD